MKPVAIMQRASFLTASVTRRSVLSANTSLAKRKGFSRISPNVSIAGNADGRFGMGDIAWADRPMVRTGAEHPENAIEHFSWVAR